MNTKPSNTSTGPKSPAGKENGGENAPTQSGRYQKGTSGNPAGRPIGSRNKATLLLEQLLAEEGELIIKKAVELAKEGNVQAVRLCLERLIPPARERYVELEVRPVKSAQELPVTLPDVLIAVAEGRITPGEAQALAGAIASHSQIFQSNDMADRLSVLEGCVDQVKWFNKQRGIYLQEANR